MDNSVWCVVGGGRYIRVVGYRRERIRKSGSSEGEKAGAAFVKSKGRSDVGGRN